MKTMRQMQHEMISRNILQEKDADGYPKLVVRFPGVIISIPNKEAHQRDVIMELLVWLFGIGGAFLCFLYFFFFG